MEVSVLQKKKLVLILIKQIQNLSVRYNNESSYLFVNVEEIIKFKVNNKNVSLPIEFF